MLLIENGLQTEMTFITTCNISHKIETNKNKVVYTHPEHRVGASVLPELPRCFRIGKALSRFRRHCGFWTEDQP